MAIEHSARQLEFYYDLCKRKGILPKDVSQLTIRALGDEIESMQVIPDKASPEQLNYLNRILQELCDAGIPGVRIPTPKFWDSLTKDNFQFFLDKANRIREKHFDKLPANQWQIDRIMSMYLFPDIDWENLSVMREDHVEAYNEEGIRESSRHIMYTESITISHKEYTGGFIQKPDGTVIKAWRFKTKDEFRKELESKLTHAVASRIIDRHYNDYVEWMRDRCSSFQRTRIRQLEQRMANIYVPKSITVFDMDMPFDMPFTDEEDDNSGLDTNVDEVDITISVTTKKVDNWCPTAYEPLQDEHLEMMSSEEANAYIQRLQYELGNRNLRNVGGGQEMHEAFSTPMRPKTVAELRTREYTGLNNFLYGLSAIVGQEFQANSVDCDSLRHHALNVFFTAPHEDGGENGAGEELKTKLRNEIIEFVMIAIETNSITFDGLLNLASQSEYANDLINDMIERGDNAKIILQQSRLAQ